MSPEKKKVITTNLVIGKDVLVQLVFFGKAKTKNL